LIKEQSASICADRSQGEYGIPPITAVSSPGPHVIKSLLNQPNFRLF